MHEIDPDTITFPADSQYMRLPHVKSFERAAGELGAIMRYTTSLEA